MNTKCQNCGEELFFRMVTYSDEFDFETIDNCVKEDDYDDLYMSSYSILQVFCRNNDTKPSSELLDYLTQYFNYEVV